MRRLVVAMIVDGETNEQVQLESNVLATASVEEVAAELALLREAAWREVLATNERRLKRSEVVKAQRQAQIDEAQAEGTELDADAIDEESAQIESSILKLRTEVAADREVAGVSAPDGA